MPDTTPTTDVRLQDASKGPADRVLRWTYRPWRDKPETAWFVTAIGLLLFLLVFAATGKWYLGLLGVAASIAILRRLLFPVTYQLDAAGVRESAGAITRGLLWKQVRRVEQCEATFVMVPHARNELLARISTIYVPADALEADVRSIVETHAPFSATWLS